MVEYLKIANLVSIESEVPIDVILGRKRKEPYPFLRQILTYLMYKNIKHIQKLQIAKTLKFHHSTILYNIEQVENYLLVAKLSNRQNYVSRLIKILSEKHNLNI